jgi:hypothetical protein
MTVARVRDRHAWPGVLLLSALAILVTALLLWGDHFLTPSPAGGILRLLEVRLLQVRPVSGLGMVVSPAGEATRLPAVGPSLADVETSSPPPRRSDPSGEAVQPPRESVALPMRATALPRSAAPSQARYALALGNFVMEEDAERAEVQLNQAGISTVRFRQQAPERLFSVSIRRLEGDGEAVAGLAGATGGGVPPPGPSSPERTTPFWVAKALPLRSAVTLAERLKASGYDVRIVAEARKVGQITLRHGNFISRQEAEAASRQIAQLGVANEVVKVK